MPGSLISLEFGLFCVEYLPGSVNHHDAQLADKRASLSCVLHGFPSILRMDGRKDKPSQFTDLFSGDAVERRNH